MSAMNKVYLQIVGGDSIDTTPSLLLFTDTQRYLFNCGEGTQRLFNEYKLRINKLNNIFFTNISWECTGGLPGLAMTLRDIGRVNLGLYGPKHFKDFIHATRHFLFHEKLQLNCNEFIDDEEKFTDDNLSIYPVILSGDNPEYHPNIENITEGNPTKRVKIESCAMKDFVCYICALPKLPGKFLVHKAKELGVPKGPLFGKLKLGEDVELENGQKVSAKDVTEPSQPGPVFFIIDCPSVDYIASLINSQKFDYYKTSGQQPCLVIHLVPMEVFNSCDYKDWRLSFGDTAEHVILNKDVCSKATIFRSQARIQMKLHTIDKSLFPLLYSSEKSYQDPKALPTNTIPGRSMLKFHLRPQKLLGYDTSDVPTALDVHTIMSETMEMITNTEGDKNVAVFNNLSNDELHVQRESSSDSNQATEENVSEVVALACTGNKGKEQESCAQEIMNTGVANLVDFDGKNKEEFEVVFIGTGASMPSKYRNVSATLLHASNLSSILLDCGEGTLGQLFRHYGSDMGGVVSKMNYIFISHIHADHHLGLIRVLLYQSKLRKASPELNHNATIVVGPTKINLWLQEYSASFENLDYRFVSCEDIAKEDHEYMGLFNGIGALQLVAVPVIHCADAYGLVFKHTTGWKAVYSGDTRPCPALITAGRDATLLIHEATFEDELHDEAVDKKHCTTSEAINSGIEMNARFIVLNHFSQRYPKIPVISEQFTKHTGIAFDHMRVRPRDFPRIPSLFSPLNVIFAEEIEEMTKKTNEKNKVSTETNKDKSDS